MSRETLHKVSAWIDRARPGAFVYRDRLTCFEMACRAFRCSKEGREVSPYHFETALSKLGYAPVKHPGGYRLVLDSRLP